MKKILLSLMVLCCAIVAKSQNDQLTATLQHGDDVSVFTGKGAYAAALDSAANGDIITLSAGTFSAAAITKSVSIFGAGFERDAEAGTDITCIYGKTNIGLSGETVTDINIEGVFFDGNVINLGPEKNDAPIVGLRFAKVKFNRDINTYSDVTNANFDQCLFMNITQRGYPDANQIVADNWLYNNCYIGGNMSYFRNGSIKIDHCIVNGSPYTFNSTTVPVLCTNSIFTNNVGLPAGSIPQYCSFTSGYSTGVNCYSINASAIFSDANNADYTINRTFELKEPDTYVGNDGTPIGIIGGNGWSKVPSTPVVKSLKLSVSGKTLNVEYEAQTR